MLLLASAAILRGIRVDERLDRRHDAHFWRDLKAGVRFVAGQRLLVSLAVVVGGWQMCQNAALVVQILFATRTLGLSEQAVGLSYIGMGAGTVVASLLGHRISRWSAPALPRTASRPAAPAGSLCRWRPSVLGRGDVRADADLLLVRRGAALHQLPRAAPGGDARALLGRMTSTMRWLILLPPGRGADRRLARRALRAARVAGVRRRRGAAARRFAWRHPVIRDVRTLPRPEAVHDASAPRPGAPDDRRFVTQEARPWIPC